MFWCFIIKESLKINKEANIFSRCVMFKQQSLELKEANATVSKNCTSSRVQLEADFKSESVSKDCHLKMSNFIVLRSTLTALHKNTFVLFG